MLIEATESLTIRRPSGIIRLQRGTLVELPDAAAMELVQKAGTKVRMITLSPGHQPGQTVTWNSPALGVLRGELLSVHSDGWVDVYHPLTEAVARIPAAWVQ